MTITRRRVPGLLLALGAGLAALTGAVAEEAAPKEFRIGYQKIGLIVVARQQGVIEKRLAAQGTKVQWVEFQAGPPLLEALSAGSIDFGYTGDAPPIFSQSAGGNLVYVSAAAPSGDGEAILVKESSPIRSVADLKGKKVAFGRGTSAHNLIIAALEKAGLTFSDITPAYLTPADAGSAFANDSVDAWSIWDPYFAVAQARSKTRVLATSGQTLDVSAYFLANRTFADTHPGVIVHSLAGLTEAAAWADGHRDEVAKALNAVTGIPYEIQKVAADRTRFGVRPLTDAILSGQQATADRFHRLGLIPRAIQVRDAVWTPPRT
ncbi:MULTISPECIES: sulfonate ABC transporter substrate-binding protein [Methylobacterium]|uniref:Putative aliphatic sulfonates-binding protein n=1 Tax=Methylobacterium bullatum TaxID=570505 RepID=A0AAV4Z7K3_9HYPH|nr:MULTISPECIES: sulfonate ABC transporter substrate-binding protein [Methylobacterium]KQO42342.1 ABC transporter substrate-binding protein [Methylobacterium sp. Leaf85]MBD8903177.1 sulfonate ABC transporter substrate-binding protein [Methylobacterium bullatum]GJD39980.1 Putative aliphatic sulfonates-binding protein [Methylobacterium bullatum]